MASSDRDGLVLGPEIRSLRAMLAHRARWQPAGLAFAASGEALTYAALAETAQALGRRLAAAGVRRGSRVALFVPAGLDFLRALYAAQWVGAAPCAFDPQTPPATAARRAARVRPDLVLVAGDQAA